MVVVLYPQLLRMAAMVRRKIVIFRERETSGNAEYEKVWCLDSRTVRRRPMHTSTMAMQSRANARKNRNVTIRCRYSRSSAAGPIHSMPARNTAMHRNNRSGPTNGSSALRSIGRAIRLESHSANRSTGRETSLDSGTSTAASRASAIQRQTGVSMTFQSTNGWGRCLSIGESLASLASCGISATLSEENNHTGSPDFRVTCSIPNSTSWPFS